MRLTEEALNDFEQIWRSAHPNATATREQLREMATKLLQAVELIYRPLPQDSDDGLIE
jgi:plasmid stabilization system protein ParE